MLASLWSVNFIRVNFSVDENTTWLMGRIGISGTVLVFTVVVSILAVGLFGLMPALKSSKPGLSAALKEGDHSSSGGRERSRMRSAIVVTQVVLAIVLTVGAGTMIRSIVQEMVAPQGFDPNQVVTVQLSLPGRKYPDAKSQACFLTQAIGRFQALPGIRFAGATSDLPDSFGPGVDFEVDGQPGPTSTNRPRATRYLISADYSSAMKIPLLRGRQFRATDSSETPLVAIINETLAKHFFQYTNPVGREIRTLGDDGKPGQWREIVGVVGDVSDYLGEDPKKPQIYVPLLQDSTSAITFVLRTTVNPAVLMPAVRQTIKTIDSEQPIYGIRTMTQVLDLQRTGDRFAGEMLGFFTILALGLAAMGTYGVVASIVVQRTHEIGLRMALGAQRSDVLRLMVRRGMALAGIGMITGLVLAIPIPRMLANAYSDSTFENTIIFVISPILILLSAGLASYLPARRAARVDPMVALRHE